jgi:hypothetical protein
MTRHLVASNFAWTEYPGLRPGRLYSGQPDIARSPLGQIHLVEGPDADETLCGLSRELFPHDFPQLTQLPASEACSACRTG